MEEVAVACLTIL